MGLQRLRCLPYFHLLGVDKSGTTDLHSRIAKHPDVLLNSGGLGKETYYWCWLKYGENIGQRDLLLVLAEIR